MSFVVSWAPLPVLSPITQFRGKPARKRASPVVFPTNHFENISRDAGARISPGTNLRRFSSIAAGDAVSLGSPGVPSFNSGSVLSRRVTAPPMARLKFVSAAGPPKLASSRLAAVEPLHATIGTLEHERDGRRFERAAHQKALVAAVSDYRPGWTYSGPHIRAALAAFIKLGQVPAASSGPFRSHFFPRGRCNRLSSS